MTVSKEPEAADAHEATRQDMQKEAANEFLGGNRRLTLFVAVSVVPPSEGNAAHIERYDTVVRDGDLASVTAEVTKHLSGSAERRLGIDDPVLAKQSAQKCGEALGLGQMLERAAEIQSTPAKGLP